MSIATQATTIDQEPVSKEIKFEGHIDGVIESNYAHPSKNMVI